MSNFKGINPDAIMLLAENRFNNSKIFYDENKETLKKEITLPLYELINSLCDELYAIDREMCLIPSKMISRFRRDTRYSRDKSLYRENVWIMFMRNKHQWEHQPCMWLEFSPNGTDWGIGIFHCQPSVMECFRKHLDERGDEFLSAYRRIKKYGAEYDFDSYKKDRSEGKDQRLKDFYNARNLYFINHSASIEKIIDGSIENELRSWIKAASPMYKFLIGVMEDMYEQK